MPTSATDALESGQCVKKDPSVQDALQCGCHSVQSTQKGGFSGPCELAVDERNATIYVTTNLTGDIIEINADTGELQRHEIPTIDPVPMPITIDAGAAFFGELRTANIGRFDLNDETFTFPAGGEGDFGTTLTTIDQTGGPLWVVDFVEGNILEIHRNGHLAQTIDLPGRLPGPRDLVDRGHKLVFTLNRDNSLYRYNKQQGNLARIVDFPEPFGPIGLGIVNDTAIVAGGLGDNIAIVNLATDTLENVIDRPTGMRPSRVTTDLDGNAWLTEIQGANIVRVNPNTSSVDVFPTPLPESAPEGIETHNGNVWYTMWAADRVARLNPDTREHETWQMPGSPVIVGNSDVVRLIVTELENAKDTLISRIRSPFQFSPLDLTVTDRVNPNDITATYDAILAGLRTFTRTEDSEAATLATMNQLPERGPPPPGVEPMTLGFAGWTRTLNWIVSLGLIETIDVLVRFIVIFIKDWLDHRLDP